MLLVFLAACNGPEDDCGLSNAEVEAKWIEGQRKFYEHCQEEVLGEVYDEQACIEKWTSDWPDYNREYCMDACATDLQAQYVLEHEVGDSCGYDYFPSFGFYECGTTPPSQAPGYEDCIAGETASCSPGI
ncbi:MAG: hypothetical protein ACI9VR_000428 [Cognaticolwellia sp.]|jgi:hypothetical protein